MELYEIERNIWQNPIWANNLPELNWDVLDVPPNEMDGAAINAYLEAIDDFLTTVSENPILWSWDVLAFLGVTNQRDQW